MIGAAGRLVIQTPEGCSFSLQLAGPIARFLSWTIDVLCIVLLTFALLSAVGVMAMVSPGLALALGFLAIFGIWFCYGIIMEWFWRGRTIGKMVFRLRVIDEQGLRLRFSQVVVRNLLRIADMLPLLYMVGGAACMLTRRCQRLGDLAAGTVVVRIPRDVQPDLSMAVADKFNSFRAYGHIEARLRQRVSPDEARVALAAVLRRDRLDADARVRLFADLAEHFRAVVEFPQAATDGLSDEQYVRNVVDTLFRPQMTPRNGQSGQPATRN
ncbi:MAG: RDD family protein [Phycisphaerae bacterium]